MNREDIEVLRLAAVNLELRREGGAYKDVLSQYEDAFRALTTPRAVAELCNLALQAEVKAPSLWDVMSKLSELQTVPTSLKLMDEEPATLDTVVEELRRLRADLAPRPCPKVPPRLRR